MSKSYAIALSGAVLAIASLTAVPARASKQCDSTLLTPQAGGGLNCLDWGVAYLTAEYSIEEAPIPGANYAEIWTAGYARSSNPYQLAATAMCSDYNLYRTGWSAPTTADLYQTALCPPGLQTMAGEVWELIQ
jgi:hypothetical protein